MWYLCLKLLFLMLVGGYHSTVLAEAHESEETLGLARYQEPEPMYSIIPLSLKEGLDVTFQASRNERFLVPQVSQFLQTAHSDLALIFGDLPPLQVDVQLVSNRKFFEITRAPSWTNALFVKGAIIMPVSQEMNIDIADFEKGVRHEYTHAAVYSLSQGKAPGWLDEGLAQLLEGDENRILASSMRKFLQSANPLPLHELSGGFTKLPAAKVVVAYGQSLFAADYLTTNKGFSSIRQYLELLAQDNTQSKAFVLAFNTKQSEFEKDLRKALYRWAASDAEHLVRPRKFYSSTAVDCSLSLLNSKSQCQ